MGTLEVRSDETITKSPPPPPSPPPNTNKAHITQESSLGEVTPPPPVPPPQADVVLEQPPGSSPAQFDTEKTDVILEQPGKVSAESSKGGSCVHKRGGYCLIHGGGARKQLLPVKNVVWGPDGVKKTKYSKKTVYVCVNNKDGKKYKQTQISFSSIKDTGKGDTLEITEGQSNTLSAKSNPKRMYSMKSD